VTAAGPFVPPALDDQLVVGGRLVMPVGPDFATQTLVRVRRQSEDDSVVEELGEVRFVPLVGRQGWPDDE
jgi:protein-L-isoaspartate(D-aspartate) O-methyltransferase